MPGEHVLVIPLDASAVEGIEPAQPIRVVVRQENGEISEQVVKLSPEGKGEVSFSFPEVPGAVTVVLGPAEAEAKELLNMETIRLTVGRREWRDPGKLVLRPVKVAPYYIYWWKRWCHTFTIHGRVVCVDGRPVPGATVNAFDVDAWFWWTSRQFVGSAVTDANGAFTITFRWCCMFFPPWWWLHRIWEIDPALIRRIKPVLGRIPDLRLGRVANQPSLEPFAPLLQRELKLPRRPLAPEDAELIEKARTLLVQKLPPAPELEKLQLWPWYPWWPWRDCTPDIIFKVTQDAVNPGTVIVNEGFADARWNIANPLTVTLVANEQAWCVPDHHEGKECLVLVEVCGDAIASIGGNMGAADQPAGYLNPGGVAQDSQQYNGDRPFAGSVRVEKDPQDMASFDYYEIEYVNEIDRVACGATFQPLPLGWAQDFYRYWLEISGSPVVVNTGYVPFNWTLIGAHSVVESREHFEDTGPLSGWNTGRWWMQNRDVVAFFDSSKFPDGTYRFRVVRWEKDSSGNLINRKVVPICNSQDDNYLVLTFDNRLNPDPGHPTDPMTHPCTAVHACVTEPDTDFISVKIGGKEVKPCDVVDLNQEDNLEIEFLVTDPIKVRDTCQPQTQEDAGAHLAYYELWATYGENLAVNLLQHATSVAPMTAGAFTGWKPGDPYASYGRALGQGTTRPHWSGGIYKATIPVAKAFPEPCCYQLELTAYKRPVVGCDHNFLYGNKSEYMVGVGICPKPPIG